MNNVVVDFYGFMNLYHNNELLEEYTYGSGPMGNVPFAILITYEVPPLSFPYSIMYKPFHTLYKHASSFELTSSSITSIIEKAIKDTWWQDKSLWDAYRQLSVNRLIGN